jgi:metallo-beta-lactamase family protein
VIETTYGDRLHKPMNASIDELYGAIADTFNRGGNVVIPTFALERAQELLWILNQGIAKKRLMRSMQVFLDSPMAISTAEIFRHHPECLEPEAARLFREGHDPLQLPGLHLTRERAESIALNNIRGGAIIMAGSGMATGGRVRHHLKHNLWRADCSVIFVGFAAKGTLARRIIDGESPVRILGENIPVRARIHTINGFSAHADQAELLAWHKQTGTRRTFLTHGERSTMQQFAARLVKHSDRNAGAPSELRANGAKRDLLSGASCPLCAKSGHSHCSKKARHSITPSALACNVSGPVRPAILIPRYVSQVCLSRDIPVAAVRFSIRD